LAALAMTAVVSFGVLIFSLDPDVGFWDTGELQVVPYILGLAHPTGYPTEILIGWAFVHALPFGEPALRMNLLCLLCVVVAAVCCCAVALFYEVRPAVAAAAGLCFAFTPLVWSHATHADVTDPALALCAFVLLLTVAALRFGRPRLLLWAAGIAGLALGTHGVVIWFLPAIIVMVLASRSAPLIRLLPLCVGIGAAVTIAVYAYLPIRSAIVTAAGADPTTAIGLPNGQAFWDWGHPASPSGFWLVVSGGPVKATNALAAIGRIDRYPEYLAFAATQLRFSYPVLALIAIVALAFWGASRTKASPALLLPLALVAPFAAGFTSESDVQRYFSFPLLCMWVLVAAALSSFELPSITRIPSAAALVLCAFAAFEVVRGRGLFEQRHDHLGSTYIAAVLAATEPNAVIVAPWVYVTPLGYAAYVRGSTASRTIVSLYPEQANPYIANWMKSRPVYIISESPPAVDAPARMLERLHVNDDEGHDPKLFRLVRKP
jgi:hypothetical protein